MVWHPTSWMAEILQYYLGLWWNSGMVGWPRWTWRCSGRRSLIIEQNPVGCNITPQRNQGGSDQCPSILIEASYTTEGTKGLMSEGGTTRRARVQNMVEAMGGKLEAFYYAFGDSDAFVIVDAPDNATTAAISLAVNSSGAVALKTTPLLTPEEIDQAAQKTVSYRPPGA